MVSVGGGAPPSSRIMHNKRWRWRGQPPRYGGAAARRSNARSESPCPNVKNRIFERLDACVFRCLMRRLTRRVAIEFPPAAAVSTDVTAVAPSLEDRIDTQVRALIDEHHTPGASVEIIKGGRRVYAGSFGLRNTARQLPANLSSSYEIGSITKHFTPAAILQLQEVGKLDIDATLATYVPRAPHASEITLRQLLSHTSGMPEYFSSCEQAVRDIADHFADASRPITFDELMSLVAGQPLDFPPGSR